MFVILVLGVCKLYRAKHALDKELQSTVRSNIYIKYSMSVCPFCLIMLL